MAQPRRLLYLDEDVPKRLATELNRRGRNALSVYTDRQTGTLDGDLVGMLHDRFGRDVVLVTANESMPIEYADTLRDTGIALAVIDGNHGNAPQEEWKRDAVHRWAHVIEEQPPGTWRRYAPHRRPVDCATPSSKLPDRLTGRDTDHDAPTTVEADLDSRCPLVRAA